MISEKDETRWDISEWSLALKSVLKYEGKQRTQAILNVLNRVAKEAGVEVSQGLSTAYANTITGTVYEKLAAELNPDEIASFQETLKYLRWNAMAMVVKAGKVSSDLGGHISTYQSSAELFEVGLHYFFQAATDSHGGDLVFFQGHATPGIYARGFLEGYFDEERLKHFRREINQPGLSSYPHPWLMPDYWQFPTVSMGLGPYVAIYQAKFLKYLHDRELKDTASRHVWAFLGDGEMSEPESQGGLSFAGRERLDNLIFVISCNLQRLDGPCWGNGQIIQEFERVFHGAGWKVIKVMWGEGWQALFNKDKAGVLQKHIAALLDGDFQRLSGQPGAYWREHFFAKDPALTALVSDLSDQELEGLLHGGHDIKQLYAAYKTALEHKGQPVVVLAKTIKGFNLGQQGAGQNIAHNKKKLTPEDALAVRDQLEFPITDQQAKDFDFITMDKKSAAYQFFMKTRKNLGGPMPRRLQKTTVELKAPDLSLFKSMFSGSGDKEMSSTMAFSRVLSSLLKSELKERIVPILVDESRTFGMEGLFRQLGIYSQVGQLYEPEDKSQLMYYLEKKDGQLLQEGLNEAGGMASWIAAATSYSSNDCPMIPFYVYYSMFGYQRVGDFVWQAADTRARGFMIGGTAGRTSLAGEGLQHQDGHNLLMFGYVPNCMTYDPTFGYEMAVIIQDGLRRMCEQQDVFYYITAMNDNYLHPAMPEGCEAGIIKGMYLLDQKSPKKSATKTKERKVRLLGGGAILLSVIEAAAILANEYGVSVDIWSVTSFNELRRDVIEVQRERLQNTKSKQTSYVQSCLQDDTSPVIAATDYLKIYADQVRSEIDAPYYVLGTDGFGRSDNRVALRDFFEVDAKYIAYTALRALQGQGAVTQAEVNSLVKKHGIDLSRDNPTRR